MRFEVDNAKIKAGANHARDIGMAALGEQALKDANYFCKEDSGVLIDSSRFEKTADGVALIWNTPYAKRQYYTGQPSPDKNPNASMMWAHKGYQMGKAVYQKILDKAAKEG